MKTNRLVTILLIGLFCFNINTEGQTLKSLNRIMSADDPNLDPNWDWTKDEVYKLIYINSNMNNSISAIYESLPYFVDDGASRYLNDDKDGADIHPKDGWVLINRDFGVDKTESSVKTGPLIPNFTLYNKLTGVLRYFFYTINLKNTYSYATVILSQDNHDKINGTLTFMDSNAPYISEPNMNFEQVAFADMSEGGWSYADFNLTAYDPNTPDYSSYSIAIFGVTKSDFEATFSTIKEETKSNSLTFQSVSNKIVESTGQSTRYFNTFEKFQNDISKKAQKDNNKWYTELLEDIADDPIIDALPIIGTAAGFISTFIGGGKTTQASLFEDVTLKGSITTTGTIYPKSIKIPGVNQRNDQIDRVSQPLYSYPLGIIGIEEPQIDFYRPSVYNFVTKRYETAYFVKLSKFDYHVNPCIPGVHVKDIKVGFVKKGVKTQFYDVETMKRMTVHHGYIINGTPYLYKEIEGIAIRIVVIDEAYPSNEVVIQRTYKNLKKEFHGSGISPEEFHTSGDLIIDKIPEEVQTIHSYFTHKGTVNDGDITLINFAVENKASLKVEVLGNNSIILKNGFSVKKGGSFYAKCRANNSQSILNSKNNKSCSPSLKSAQNNTIQETLIDIEKEKLCNNADAKFSIYPNPFKTLLNIKTNSFDNTYSYQLLNINGSRVMQGTASGNYQVNTSDLASGIYFLIITDSKGNVHRNKVVK